MAGFNILDAFRGNQPPPQQQQPQGNGTPPGAAPNSGGGSAPGSGMPNQAPNPGAGAGTGDSFPGGGANDANKKNPDGSPLDAFKDIFTIDPNKPQSADPFKDPLFTLDPQKFGQAVGKMDFTRGLNPEKVASALGGDQAAFSEVLNHVSRTTYGMVSQMFVGILENGFKRNNERYDTSLDGKMRNFQISNTSSTNKALQHPAAKPVLAALRQQIASQNPTMSPSEVSSRADDYFLAMGKALTTVDTESGAGAAGDKKNAGGGAVDWEKFMQDS